MKQHPLYLKHPKNKIIFIVHIVNTSGQWDLRDIASEDLSPCIQRTPLGSINSVHVREDVYVIHAYAARLVRSKDTLHPICYPFLGKCIMQMRDLNGLNCDVYLSRKSCRLHGASPSTVKEMMGVVLKDTEIKEF